MNTDEGFNDEYEDEVAATAAGVAQLSLHEREGEHTQSHFSQGLL